MGVFIDDFSNTYRTPYIPQKVVGFSGIDLSSPGDGGDGGLSEDEINALIALYVSNLKIRIDSGRIDDEDEPVLPTVDLRTKDIPHNALDGLQGGQNGEYYHLTATEYDKLKDYPLYAQLIASRLHEPLPDLLGGNANGHYHLTEEELENLRKLIAALIPAGTVVIPSGGTEDHEQLQNLLGGDGNGHYHVTDDEWNKIRKLIAATFPPGSPVPVFPSGPVEPSDPDNPDDPTDDPSLDPFAGLPSTMALDWSKMSLNGYTAYDNAGRMYYGTMVTGSKPYTKTSLLIPLMKTGKTNYTYICSFKTDLSFDKYEKQASVSTFAETWADYIYVDWGDTDTAKRFYAVLPGCSSKTKDIFSRNTGGWSDPGTSKVTSGFTACCYSAPVDRVLLVTSKGEVTWIYDSNAKATTFSQKLLDASTSCGLSAVNIACAKWSTEVGLFCVTGPGGVAVSETGDAGTWTVYTDVPKDLHDLEYREDIEGISGGAFIGWSGVDRYFYVSRDGKTWTHYSSKAIPMSDVVQVAYGADCGWYCAVGASGNKAYFSKTLTNWVATTISNSDDTPAQSVIWMPPANKFVILPKSGTVLYTYEVTI